MKVFFPFSTQIAADTTNSFIASSITYYTVKEGELKTYNNADSNSDGELDTAPVVIYMAYDPEAEGDQAATEYTATQGIFTTKIEAERKCTVLNNAVKQKANRTVSMLKVIK